MNHKSDQSLKRLYILRGLPQSGKSSLAKEIIYEEGKMFSPEDYFSKSGEYIYNPSMLPEAYAECREGVKKAMESECPKIVVHDTFSRRWEAEPYLELAKKFNYSTAVIECQSNFGRPINATDETAVLKMIERWEPLV